jgi:hypothetical protein
MITLTRESKLTHSSSAQWGCIFLIINGVITMNSKNVRLPIIAVTEQEEESIPYTDCEQILAERFSSIENKMTLIEEDSQDFVILVMTEDEEADETYPAYAIWIQFESTLTEDENSKYQFMGNFSSKYFDVEYSYDAESGVDIPNYVILDITKRTN